MINQWNSTPNNKYTALTITPDCHKHFQLKIMFDKHI